MEPELRKAAEVELAWAHHTGVIVQCRRIFNRARLSERQNHRCCWCGVRMTDAGASKATIEHIIPRALGGSDKLANLAVSCFQCNTMRGADVHWQPPNIKPGRRCYE